MECFELDIGGMAGNSQSRASCGRRFFSEETIENEKEEEEVVGALNFGIKGTLVK